jgi:hypothetical protein
MRSDKPFVNSEEEPRSMIYSRGFAAEFDESIRLHPASQVSYIRLNSEKAQNLVWQPVPTIGASFAKTKKMAHREN